MSGVESTLSRDQLEGDEGLAASQEGGQLGPGNDFQGNFTNRTPGRGCPQVRCQYRCVAHGASPPHIAECLCLCLSGPPALSVR
jgi:hypothetical protein